MREHRYRTALLWLDWLSLARTGVPLSWECSWQPHRRAGPGVERGHGSENPGAAEAWL